MKKLNFRKLSWAAVLLTALLFSACNDDDDGDAGPDAPDEVNEVEVITDVTLRFSSMGNPDVIATAQDPDGEGVEELQILDTIRLAPSTMYTLTIEAVNNLDPDDPEDISEEIMEEDDEHQLFYRFPMGTFSTPTGNGNIDNAADPVVYNDFDENGLPLGLNTSWTTGMNMLDNSFFTVRLQHQPEMKTATSDANVGETEIDLTFVLEIN